MTEMLTKEKIQILEDFTKRAITLIINIRTRDKLNHLNIKELLTLTTPFNSTHFTEEGQDDFFDIDDFFIDEYEDISISQKQDKNYIIDIYCKYKKEKLLIERWAFHYRKEYSEGNELYFRKKLEILLKTIYLLIKILPTNKCKCTFNGETFYKFYQSNKMEQFSLIPEGSFKISNCYLMNFTLHVNYLSLNQIKDYISNTQKFSFNNNVNNNFNMNMRQRFYSESLAKKPSFEILNYYAETTLVNEEYFSRRMTTQIDDYFSPNPLYKLNLSGRFKRNNNMNNSIEDEEGESNELSFKEEISLGKDNKKYNSNSNSNSKNNLSGSSESLNLNGSFKLCIDDGSSGIRNHKIESIIVNFSKIKREFSNMKEKGCVIDVFYLRKYLKIKKI